MILIAIAALILGVGVAVYFYVRHRKRTATIDFILHDPDLLAHWTYGEQEWRRAVEEEFTWASRRDNSGEAFISPSKVYLRGNASDRLIDLSDCGKVVTHASFTDTEGMPLKLRVRWKVVRRNPDRATEVKFHKEDYRIPVPATSRQAAIKVADYFTRRLQDNLDAYTSVVPDDEPISLFGKDEF